MTRICWRLAELASQALQPEERDAVLGDFAESGERSSEALCGVLGLVVRRQAALWKDWRLWLVLIGLVLPLAWVLSINSRFTANANAVYCWSYLNNWDWSLLKYASFWYILRDSLRAVFMQSLVLVCWSWSAGFLLGSASRRFMPSSAVLFFLFSLLGQVLGASTYLIWFSQEYVRRPLPPNPHQPISALLFYRQVFPMIVTIVLVILPAFWAMRRASADRRRLPTALRILLSLVASCAMIAMTIREPGLGFFVNPYTQLAIFPYWPRPSLPFFIYWPIAYLLVSALAHHWQKERI